MKELEAAIRKRGPGHTFEAAENTPQVETSGQIAGSSKEEVNVTKRQSTKSTGRPAGGYAENGSSVADCRSEPLKPLEPLPAAPKYTPKVELPSGMLASYCGLHIQKHVLERNLWWCTKIPHEKFTRSESHQRVGTYFFAILKLQVYKQICLNC